MNKKKNIVVWIAVIAIILVAAAIGVWKKIPTRAYNKLKGFLSKDVNVYKEYVEIDGLDEEYKIIFLADSHIALCDSRDSELKEAAGDRYAEFTVDSKGPDKNFSLTMDYIVGEKPDLVIFGGDIADNATYSNVEFIEKELAKLECPYVFLMGNHDFNYNEEYFTQKSYDEYLARFENINGDSDGIEILKFDEFTILSLDDNNYQVPNGTKEAVAELQKEGKPVIVALHSPLVPTKGEELLAKTRELWPPVYLDYSRVLMGEFANTPNEETSALIDFIKKDDSLVYGVFAGHLHFYSKDWMNPHAYQYVAPAGFEREILEIILE